MTEATAKTLKRTIKPKKHGSKFWGFRSTITTEYGVEVLTTRFSMFIAFDPQLKLEENIRWGGSPDYIKELERAVVVAREAGVPYLGDSMGYDHSVSIRWQRNTPEGDWYGPRVSECGFSKNAATALTKLAVFGWNLTPEQAVKVLRATFFHYDEKNNDAIPTYKALEAFAA